MIKCIIIIALLAFVVVVLQVAGMKARKLNDSIYEDAIKTRTNGRNNTNN